MDMDATEQRRFTPQHVANYFLKRAKEEGRGLSPLKLIKLVYIAYGWALALSGRKLFDEHIEAWDHGPVIPSLYHEFKHYRKSDIDEYAESFDMDSFEFEIPQIPEDEERMLVILGKVWDSYKMFTGSALRNKTHAPGTPWHTVYQEGLRNVIIPDDLIEGHYKERIEQYLEAGRQ